MQFKVQITHIKQYYKLINDTGSECGGQHYTIESSTLSQDRAGAKGGLGPPIDMLAPPNQQAYSFEDSSFCALFQTLAPLNKRLASLNRLLWRRLCHKVRIISSKQLLFTATSFFPISKLIYIDMTIFNNLFSYVFR